MTVRGWTFSGKGKTKKVAKLAAAESALQYLNDVVNVGPNATGNLETVRSRAEEMGKRERERETFAIQHT